MKGISRILGAVVLCAVVCPPVCSAESREGDVTGRIPANHVGTEWIAKSASGAWQGLVKDGVQIGAYNAETHEWYTVDRLTGQWSRGDERAYCREDAQAAIQLRLNPGVDWRKTQREASGYRINGRPVTEYDAFASLKPSPKLGDDSSLPSLTIIGTEAECRAVEQEIERNPRLKPLRSSFLLQSYRPGDLMVSRYGFVAGGRPTIYMTDAKGKVLFRADELGDPGTFGEAVEAGVQQCCPPRKPHPDYEPFKDPEPEKFIRKAAGWGWIPWAVGLVVIAGLVVVLFALVVVGLVVVLRGKPPVAAVAPPLAPPAANGEPPKG